MKDELLDWEMAVVLKRYLIFFIEYRNKSQQFYPKEILFSPIQRDKDRGSHHNDVTWASWHSNHLQLDFFNSLLRLTRKPPASTSALWWESIGGRWFPSEKLSNAKSVSTSSLIYFHNAINKYGVLLEYIHASTDWMFSPMNQIICKCMVFSHNRSIAANHCTRHHNTCANFVVIWG